MKTTTLKFLILALLFPMMMVAQPSNWWINLINIIGSLGNNNAPNTYYWEGKVDSDWDNAANWRSGIVPNSAQISVDIRWSSNNPVIGDSLNIEIDNLRIRFGTSLSLRNGAALTVRGDIDNFGTLTKNSSAVLIQTAASDDNGGLGLYRIRRNTGFLADDRRFQYWSSPLSDETVADVFGPNAPTAGAANPADWFYFNDLSQSWMALNGADQLSAGYGFSSTGTKGNTTPFSEIRTFQGRALNNGAIARPNEAPNDGFILVGNPYPSPIDALDFINAQSNITGSIYFWDGDGDLSSSRNGGYATWNASGGTAFGKLVPDGIIRTCQSFMVQVNSNGTPPANIVFNNSMRRNATNNLFFKNEQRQRVWISAITEDGFFCQQLIALMPGATPGVDQSFDGLFINDYAPLTFYSLIGEETFAIQALPRLQGNREYHRLPLGLSINDSMSINIKLDSLNQWPADQNVYLIDKFENQKINLLNETYEVELNAGFNSEERFELLIEKSTYADQGLGLEQDWYVEDRIFNLFGDRVEQANELKVLGLNGAEYRRIALDQTAEQVSVDLNGLNTGIYLVQLNGDQPSVIKIYLP